jgi:hypothetical protein
VFVTGRDGVEVEYAQREDPATALRYRDALRITLNPAHYHVRVLDPDLTDPPIRGALEWCEHCLGCDQRTRECCDACGANGWVVT